MKLDELKVLIIRSLKEEAVAREKSMRAHQHREAFFASATQQELAEWEAFLDGLSAWMDSANPTTANEAIADLDEAFPWAADKATAETANASQVARAEEREAIATYIELGSAHLGSAHVSESQAAFYSGMMDELAEHIREGLHLPESDRATP